MIVAFRSREDASAGAARPLSLGDPMRSTIIVAMRRVFAGVLIGLVAACAQQRPAPSEPAAAAPEGFPETYYRQAAARGTQVFRVDPATSVVVIEVYRGGSLARLGHDHVIASHDVRGYAAPSVGRADLYVPLDRLVVDEPELRREAGFDTQPTDEDIAGTRRNMLNAMEASAFPFALVRMAGGEGRNGELLGVTIVAHGVEHTVQVPLRVDVSSGSLAASGRITLKQTDFGMTPLSVLGGAVQVKDEVNVRYAIRATALE